MSSSSPSDLKKLPLEALVDVEITSASRRPENLWQTSSAVDVITADDIEHAGVTTLPDALRLGTEVQVAQIDGHSWAVSGARLRQYHFEQAAGADGWAQCVYAAVLGRFLGCAANIFAGPRTD